MKTTIISILTFLGLTANLSFCQVNYTWVGGEFGNFTTASNWSPIRLNGQVSDILHFNSGGIVIALNVQQQTIGQLLITNKTHVILSPASGNPKVLFINGGSGEDVFVENGSTLEISGPTPCLGILLKHGTTGSIAGTMIIKGNQPHFINAEDSNSLIFHNGSSLIQNSPGNVFTNSGTNNAVIFENGSSFILQNISALSPFGLFSPASKVEFYPQSLFIMQVSNPAALSLNGRTYGNLIVEMNSSLSVNESFSSDVSFNNVVIRYGSILNINNTSSSYSPSFYFKGDLTMNGNFGFVKGTNKITVYFSGSTIQTISGRGILNFPADITGINFNNTTGINLNKEIAAGCPVNVNSNLYLNRNLVANTIVYPGGTISGNNGYVIGNLTKYFTPGLKTQRFEIGTHNGYSPVTISFNSINSAGWLTVNAVSAIHPFVKDSTETLRRFWNISNHGIEFDYYAVTFHYLSKDFNTNFIESRDEANMLVKNFNVSVSTLSANTPNINYRDTLDNLIGIWGIKYFGDFTMVKNDTDLISEQNKLHIDKNKFEGNGLTSNKTSNTPSEFGISQNYPNPFNPSTKINYQVPFESNVTIIVFDIDGRKVSEPVNEVQDAGYYSIQINSQNLSSGIYFYKIVAINNYSKFEKTLKMIAVK